ncbi:AAA family ATPase, partial [Klebsiella pneumoniae]|nr:AAA family ATPase [Klebsiella pneumoniae]
LNILCKLKFESIFLHFQGGGVSIQHGDKDNTLNLEHYDSDSNIFAFENLELETELVKNNDLVIFQWSSEETKRTYKNVKEKQLSSEILSFLTSDEIVSFIRADRLQAEEGNESVIDSCASKLKNLMETAQDESAALSQKLDATFPIRLFERLEQQKRFSSTNIQARLSGIQDKRRNYM